MKQVCVGDKAVDLRHPSRGVAVVKSILHGEAKLWYPQFRLTVFPVRVRDLEVK